MATAKKTPVKAPAAKKAAFPTPAPKGGAKPATAAKVKALKRGDPVSTVRRNGETAEGKVSSVESKPNGKWVTINTSTDKKKPDLLTVRESQVTRL